MDEFLHCVGWKSQPELPELYAMADVLVVPTIAQEGLSRTAVEAMASGCPVINTWIPHSGVPWVSLHEETGLTVPVDDPVALADAANRLLAEPGLRDRLAAAARERAVRVFDHRVMAERTLRLYHRVLADPGRAGETGRAVMVPSLP